MADEDGGHEASEADGEAAGRDVVVPLRAYKAVVVFSTLFAIASVVGGFMALDVATQRASLPPRKVNIPLAALGLGLIVGGGAVYAFASRFRAPGMGTTKNDDEQSPDNG